ncbi:MAG: thermonuclease family protein [Amylibacter sp.]|nr:thermonuclease family protein [Amylibacter sp.]
MRRLGLSGSIITIIALLLLIPPVIDALNGAVKSKSRCDVALVMDGDTIKISCPGYELTSGRILGYDSPEKNARCIPEYILAIRATWGLRTLLWQARTVEIRQNGKDRYQRDLIELRVNGKDVKAAMIRKGLARAYNGGRRGSWCE